MQKFIYYTLLLFFGFSTVACHRHLNSTASHPFPYVSQKQAFSDSGMVVTAHPLATEVGVNILKQGGNAVDAAVAVQMALAVVYPQAGNIGGGGFMIYRSADGSAISALDYREKAPSAAFRDMYLDSLGNVISELSQKGRLASGVPGSVAGMWASHQKYGKLPWAKLLQPAIDLANGGFRITAQEANNLNNERANFLKYNPYQPSQFLSEKWHLGDLLIQNDLSKTLKAIQKKGRDGFYSGAVAELIAKDAKKNGGIITKADLSNYQPAWRTPIDFTYRDCRIISMPPSSSGGILLQQMLGMLAQEPIEKYAYHSAEAVHLKSNLHSRIFPSDIP